MNAKERILSALSHKEPDHVPVDFSSHRSSGISAIAYHKLRNHLGLPEKPIRVYDLIQQLALVDDDVLDWFGTDAVELGHIFALDDSIWTDWTLPNGIPCLVPNWRVPQREQDAWVLYSDQGRPIGRMPDGALYFEQCFYPYLEDDQEDLDAAMQGNMWAAAPSPPGPMTSGAEGRTRLREQARNFRESTDRAIVALFGGNLLETGQMMYRADTFFLLLAENPQQAHAFLDRLVEFHLENLTNFLNDVAPYVDIVLFGDDLGMQSGPQISPRMYREFFKPRHQLLWSQVKKMGLSVMLHCCGGVRPLLADLIDAGLDAINPVQVSCNGMDLRELKKDYGSEICFWGGGCDTQHILPNAQPHEIHEHVLKAIEIMRPGGGFVFQQVHNILADSPPEHIVAMVDAIHEANADQ